MGAGRYRHRITFKQKSVTRDSFNAEVIDWVNIGATPTVWGRVERISGREFVEQDAAGAQISSKVVIRWRDDLKPSMRAVSGAQIMNIEAILPGGDRKECLLMCSMVVEPTPIP